jgi:hypothetical protein
MSAAASAPGEADKRPIYGRALGLVGVSAMFLRQQMPPTPQ